MHFLRHENECCHASFHISALCFTGFINNNEVALSVLGITIKGKVHPEKHIKYGYVDVFSDVFGDSAANLLLGGAYS